VEKSNETAAKEAVVARLFAEQGRSDLTFEIEESTPRRVSGERWHLPIRLRIPAAQLQFADEKQEQVARVKILIVAANGVSEMTKITEDDLRVVSGKHIDPEGFVNYSVKILVDQRGSELSIGVFDERSGLVGVKTIDNRRRFAASASAR
jgi:hypothetical protein